MLIVADQRVKFWLMQLARELKFLSFNGHKVELLQDLPVEALARRCEMKKVTHQFMGAKIRYRWSGAALLSVYYKGERYAATDVSTEWELLNKLGLAKWKRTLRKILRKDWNCCPPRKT